MFVSTIPMELLDKVFCHQAEGMTSWFLLSSKP
jgi:hypothetical protein